MGRPWAGRRRVVGGFVVDVGLGETTLVLFAAGASRRSVVDHGPPPTEEKR